MRSAGIRTSENWAPVWCDFCRSSYASTVARAKLDQGGYFLPTADVALVACGVSINRRLYMIATLDPRRHEVSLPPFLTTCQLTCNPEGFQYGSRYHSLPGDSICVHCSAYVFLGCSDLLSPAHHVYRRICCSTISVLHFRGHWLPSGDRHRQSRFPSRLDDPRTRGYSIGRICLCVIYQVWDHELTRRV
jgi:hypothetical protein